MPRASESVWQAWMVGPGMMAAATRLARGGSASGTAEGLPATSRAMVSASRPMTGHAYIGFRCVKPLEMLSRATP